MKRTVAGNQYPPLNDRESKNYYELYKEFKRHLKEEKSHIKYKEYAKMRNKYEGRLLVKLGVMSEAEYEASTSV